MSRFNVNAVRCEALFVSTLQPSDAPSAPRVRAEIQQIVQHLGSRGCAARVAQEFGDHPEAAILRMRWAREAVERAFVELPATVSATEPVRRLVVAESST